MSDEQNFQELEKALFKLSEQELLDIGITQVPNETAPMWLIAFSGDTLEEHEAITRTLEPTGIQCLGVCSRGSCGWYVFRESFFASRALLLSSVAVNKLQVRIVTPQILN